MTPEKPKHGSVHPSIRTPGPIIGYIYYNWKSKDLYEVKDIGIHSETNEELVCYKCVRSSKTFFRPLNMWSDYVWSDEMNGFTPRFKVMNDD